MQAHIVPALIALLLLAAALGWALVRFPRVPKRGPGGSAGPAARGRREAVLDGSAEGLAARFGSPGQAVLGVGVPGLPGPPTLAPAELEAWAEANPGGLVLLRASALGGGCQGERLELLAAAAIEELAVDLVLLWDEDPDRLLAPDPEGRVLLRLLDGLWLREAGGLVAPRAGALGELARPSRGGARGRALALIGATCLVVLGAAAVATARGWLAEETSLLGDLDAQVPQAIWLAWWVGRWFDEGGPLFTTTHLFWPHGSTLVRHTGGLLPHLFSGLLVRAQGLQGWNTFVFLALVANGLGMAWLARRLGASTPATFAAAAAFVLAPPVLAQVAEGRPELFTLALLPVALGLGLRSLATLRARDGWLAGVAFALVLLTGWLQGVVAVLLFGALALERALRRPRRRAEIGAQASRVARLVALASLAALPLVGQAARGDLLGFGMELPHLLSGDPRGEFVVDELVRRAWRPGLVTALGGALVLGFALARRRLVAWLALLLAGAVVLALGPWMAPVSGLTGGWTNLPLAWLWTLVPGASLLKRPDDLLVFASFALALLFAFGLDTLSTRLRWILAPVLAVLPVLGGEAPVSAEIAQTSKAWEILEGEGAVAYVPVGLEGPHLLALVENPRPIVGGPGARTAAVGGRLDRRMAEDPAQSFLLDSRGTLPTVQALDELGDQGLAYVVLDFEIVDAMMRAGAPEAEALMGTSMVLDDLLGPAILIDGGLRVYRVP